MIVTCALMLGAITGTTGCKKLLKGKKDAGAGGTTTTGGTAGTPQDDADEQMLVKIDAYIDCLNSLSSQAHMARSRYFQWVNPKTGPTGNERFVYGIYEIPKNEAEECRAAVTKANALPPRDAKLEGAGEEFARAILTLDALVDDAHKYYEDKNYRDDKWAKGKALHPQLMAAFSTFSKADSALHSTLDGVTKPLSQRTLQRIEREEGKKFRYHRKHALISARELVESGDPVGEDDDLDLPLMEAAFNEFDKALTELETYGTAHKKDLEGQQNPSWPMASSNYDWFLRAGNDYRKKSKEYVRCLRAAPAKAKSASGKIDPDKMPPCPDGRPKDVVAKYNEFIKTSNAHQFP